MTPSSPLVSIITPSYNQSVYLEDTIRSVLAQDYPAIEYILVDGASTDGSLEIIQRYAHRLTWWVSEPDAGQAEAINKGLVRARGEVVAWLNSDDLYLPGAVAQAVTTLQSDPAAGMVYGNAITIDAQGWPLNRLVFPDWSLEDFMGFRIICQPAVFMRREALDRAGRLDPSYHYMLDHHLWLRMARIAPVRHVPAILAAARHHPQAKNVAKPAGFGHETLRILAWMQDQPDLASRMARNRSHILAGAHRLNARYLLDAGQPGPALRAYGRAVLAWPGFALRHWHRMLYATLCLLGGAGLVEKFIRRQSAQKRRAALHSIGLPAHSDWPGIKVQH